ncbi:MULTISPECIES: DUF2889 domain-containing protein [unclassified Sphingopyxis]|uniref:DUF2889 domain-containing protein n=1 Tax=unclassified Sphingopyxis TaxID=2614943 RepID=UPI0007366DC5|nr:MULTISPECIES: DUF2889 domain-containing protein [unclassified Sphingopyxis]KTE44928.1 hypothetical protein ATE62_02355 [Sphingopyxis sp. HIX]KTE81038.1 hypothetical protein ATE72_17220 [Sphingopyxis sp. HXXIV]
MNAPQQFPFARQSAGPAPLRRPGSIRRTSSIDSDWPDGFGQPWIMSGRVRDLLTPFEGMPVALASGEFRIRTSPIREIMEIDVAPHHARAQEMVGVRAGGASRQALAATLGDLRGSPLFQLLDDFAGASLVAGWIWSRWTPDWHDRMRASRTQSTAGNKGRMVNICTGFTEGGSSLGEDGSVDHSDQSATIVGPLVNPDDPIGWHELPVQEGRPMARRSRRIDLWRAEGVLKVDAGFQDSGPNPEGSRTAIHEYRVYAEIDEANGTLLALQALPLILPFRECPGASMKAARMVGQDVGTFRQAVLDTLVGTIGCTHLNDVLRALADVPALAAMLPENKV